MLGFIINIVAGYMMACMMTSSVSVHLAQTDWGYIATYFWIILGIIILNISLTVVTGVTTWVIYQFTK